MITKDQIARVLQLIEQLLVFGHTSQAMAQLAELREALADEGHTANRG
jgi:hypothetical protein